MPFKNKQKGLTLVEVLVAAALFALLSSGIYQAFVSLSGLAQLSKLKVAAMALAGEQLEIARNLPYNEVGIVDGLPSGKLPYQKTETRGGVLFLVTTTVRNIDDPFDGTIGGNPNDLSPADYKLVAVAIECHSCLHYEPITLTTRVAPKNLEIGTGNGAMFVQVIDANGQPVSDADVTVTNIISTTTLVIQDTTNNDGLLQLIDLPPGDFAYQVMASKDGFSSARTYASGEGGIVTPISPNATVLAGQLTQLSLVIDRLSNLQLKTIDQFCQPTGPFSLRLWGTAVLDAEGNFLVYDEDHTIPAGGSLNLNNLNWDTYNFTPEDVGFVIAGSFPLQSVLLAPGATMEVRMLLTAPAGRGMLVAAKDGSTGLPLSEVAVTLSQGGDPTTLTTSQGFLRETDWSAGGGTTDGNIEIADPAGELKLKKILDQYVDSGYLISQVFDIGTATTTFYNLTWQPLDQASSTGENSVRFQLATSNDEATSTWNFLGPDGTGDSFYTTSQTDIHSTHDNQRYLRYKVYLATADPDFTPNLAEVAVTYGSECLPFGQVFFANLNSGEYQVTAQKDGYQDYYSLEEVSADWQILEVVLNPL